MIDIREHSIVRWIAYRRERVQDSMRIVWHRATSSSVAPRWLTGGGELRSCALLCDPAEAARGVSAEVGRAFARLVVAMLPGGRRCSPLRILRHCGCAASVSFCEFFQLVHGISAYLERRIRSASHIT